MSFWRDRHEKRKPQGGFRWLERGARYDRQWAIALHRRAAHPLILAILIVTSRLGDGLLWYGLMLALPLADAQHGMSCTLQMLGVGGLNLLLYYSLKRGIGRPRPFVNCPDIRACTPALDKFSFPSGHVLHAVSYAVILSHHYPVFASPLWAFAALVAASRIALGLHYPSDVLAGAITGAATATLFLAWP